MDEVVVEAEERVAVLLQVAREAPVAVDLAMGDELDELVEVLVRQLPGFTNASCTAACSERSRKSRLLNLNRNFPNSMVKSVPDW